MYQKGIENCILGYTIAKKEGNNHYLISNCDCLHKNYKAIGKHKNALAYFEEMEQIKDSTFNEEKTREIAYLVNIYRFNKARAEDSIRTADMKRVKDAEILAHKSQLKQEATMRYALYAGLIFLILFGGFMYNRFKVTSRQKKIIETQKQEVEFQKNIIEEKNHEILDSITYARRLQEAILPPLKVVRSYFPNSFILYKPKDIVAGDFYYMETIHDKVVLAAADCTGHGVPGAMVSVVCSNALNRTVKEFKILDPGAILDKVKQLVVETFEKSEDEVKDGMDISLCMWNTRTNELQWAGANNPLWILRQNEIQEIKGDKQPVGKSIQNSNFTTHKLQLNPGDSFYIFTDGYEDQFGGEKGKKFKSANMKNLFLSVKNENMETQRNKILTAFNTWKGNLEQVDDVCVIGVRI